MKYITILITSMFFSVGAYSQVAVGARGGVFGVDGNSYGGIEVSVQKIGEYEFDLGWTGNNSWKATGLKQFTILGKKKGFSLYGGFGGGAGIVSDQFHANLALDAGLSLRLIKFLQLSLDYRPEWAITNNSSTNTRFAWNNIAMGVRIVFP